jgi:hypothetical protein
MNQVQSVNHGNVRNREAVLDHLRNEITRMNNMPTVLHARHVFILIRYFKLVLPYAGHPQRLTIESKIEELQSACTTQNPALHKTTQVFTQ